MNLTYIYIYIQTYICIQYDICIYIYIYIYIYNIDRYIDIVLSIYNGRRGIKVLNKKSFILHVIYW